MNFLILILVIKHIFFIRFYCVNYILLCELVILYIDFNFIEIKKNKYYSGYN